MAKTTLLDLRAKAEAREMEAARLTAGEPIEPQPVLVIDGRPCWFPADAVLTIENVAALLGCSPKTVRRRGIPNRDGLYLYRAVVAYLASAA